MQRIIGLLAALWLAVVLSFGPAHADTAPRKVIIDDEGFALMHLMLLESDKIDVVGITTVSGNTWANRATAMALRGLEIADRPDIPVVQGATYPLLNSEALTERWEALYGKLTWKGAWMKEWAEPTVQSTPVYYGPNDPVDLPNGNPKLKPLPEVAANFMIRMVHQYPGQITIVACGPLTNLALAQRLDPQFASLVGELVYMGGSFNPHQVLDTVSAAEFAREYANSPRREFNARFDPEAASIVSHSEWRKLTVIPADPSTATQLTPDLLKRLAKAAAPDVGAFIAGMEAGFPLWDEIAAGYLLDPAIETEGEDLYVDYNTQFGPDYGDTLSWREHYQPGLGEREAHVVRAIDPKRLEAVMVNAMAQGAKRTK
ncbi:nucleoside hydrolase [Novosphingobium mangrovi (ex Huang et al. 2023)]|uniref:Nucleoside hydrolase n=1 Tax=Novosphingobium mangrovi (ex Huang et al. 2023) TaxID=2976432 RepID=A0ABT2I2E0_9SPHN|nr:nucleoside hydrolase [Novosphingobium mangrovi (ex Huang et al. 2023)]MCT2398970.1 nucleoside hydrolase [Novosphingobium mangrovi (ex Huang et al. 2023)]